MRTDPRLLLFFLIWGAVAVALRLDRRLGSIRAILRGIDVVGRRPATAIVVVGVTAGLASAILAYFPRLPEPWVHDEFSYLLGSDTFSRGRLTNATHPHWEHFEAYHVLHRPHYMTKYPPGQSAALALGQVMFGRPIVGVWLTVAGAAAGLTWMMYGWLRPRWAFLGSWLASSLIVLSYWSQSYWGGALAALGGALVFGAVRRLWRTPRTREALLLAAGLALLATSRPYEGLLAVLSFLGPVVIRIVRTPPHWTRRVTIPLAAAMTLLVAALLGYNVRTTGSPLLTAYQLHQREYGAAPLFLWQDPTPPVAYRNKPLFRFYQVWARSQYESQRTWKGFRDAVLSKLRVYWEFYLGTFLTIPLVMLPWVLRRRWMAMAGTAILLMTAGLAVATWITPHYAAPALGLVVLLVTQSLRVLCTARWRRFPVGRALVVALVGLSTISTARAFWHWRHANWGGPLFGYRRADLSAEILRRGGRHLVIVRPTMDIEYHDWVSNGADIDGSPIAWAREMDPEANRRLIAYFSDRAVWLLAPRGDDVQDVQIEPYPGARSQP